MRQHHHDHVDDTYRMHHDELSSGLIHTGRFGRRSPLQKPLLLTCQLANHTCFINSSPAHPPQKPKTNLKPVAPGQKKPSDSRAPRKDKLSLFPFP